MIEQVINVLVVDDEPAIIDFYLGILRPRQATDASNSVMERRRRRQAPEEQAADGTYSVDDELNIITAQSGEEAVELVQRLHETGERVAVGFFDMKMPPGIDGLETIRRLKLIDSDTHCAIVTAYTDRDIRYIAELFESPDEWIYFNKPFTEGELLQALSNLVAGWKRRVAEKEIEVALGVKVIEWS